jgi:hypothetical protein
MAKFNSKNCILCPQYVVYDVYSLYTNGRRGEKSYYSLSLWERVGVRVEPGQLGEGRGEG